MFSHELELYSWEEMGDAIRRTLSSVTLWNLLCVSTSRLVWIQWTEALRPSFQCLVQLRSSSSPEDSGKLLWRTPSQVLLDLLVLAQLRRSLFILHHSLIFKKNQSHILPHLGYSSPSVSAANWRQVSICCHRNWCINPRAPSLWCRGQYGWTSLFWNKLAQRRFLRRSGHVSFLCNRHNAFPRVFG